MVPTSALSARATPAAAARPRVASATAPPPQRVRRAPSGVARQIKDQRRGYARATILRQALTPL
jgi:hypothetical protein